VPEGELEQALRNFDRVATPVRSRGERSVWRFEFHDRTYYLYFYPRHGALSAWFRKRWALGEFFHLQVLQKADILSPRAVAHLSGFRVKNVLGDALIVESIDGAVPLDQFLLENRPSPAVRRAIVDQIIRIVNAIGRLKLGHRDLRLSSFLVRDGTLYFSDASRLHGHGMQMEDVLRLGHDAARFATRTELIRAWNGIEPDYPAPPQNPLSPKLWHRLAKASLAQSDEFQKLTIGEWSGYFPQTVRYARRWSVASRLPIRPQDWQTAWPILLSQIESSQLTPIKQDPSGDVFEAEVILAGRPISVIVKRPRQKIWWRLILDFFRPSRGSRMWLKTWMVVVRDLPCEAPLLLMQRRIFGGIADAILVFERIPGPRLDKIDLNSLAPVQRERLFYRAGRILRQLEESGLINYDSKSTNWIVYDDPHHGPSPIMIDCYGVRGVTYFLQGWGIQRLLRAMKNHKQYTPADSLALCRGFAPRATHFEQEHSGHSS
jgi:hypothetical protein